MNIMPREAACEAATSVSYIEREALREELRHCCIVAFDERSGEPYVIDIPQLLRRTTVSADVAPVVRCKDCKQYNTTGCSKGFGWCERMDRGVHDDFYCSYGERRESEVEK